MDIRQLRYFLAVADAGHITRAAQVLGLQQPPLSQQIRNLEETLGLALFKRHPKGVTLTDAGRELQAEAQQIVDRMELLSQRMQRHAAGRRGQLSVGFTSSAAAHAFTPSVLRACRSEYPEVELQISENNAAELIEALAQHRLHVGFLRVPVAQPPGLVFETLLTEPAVLALPVDHPLAQRFAPDDVVPWRALAGEKLILVRRPGAPGLYANLLALLARRRVPVRVVAEVERMMSNINLVASGSGISIVPASMQGAHPVSVVYRALPREPAVEAPITLAHRAESSGTVFDRFLALARRTAQQHREPRVPQPTPAPGQASASNSTR
jgi:DNA-binding transcriptional LysR family regulator